MINKHKLCRSTMRGIRKCPRCQHYNGNRAKGCSNNNCPLNSVKKEARAPKNTIDCVKLISYNDTRIYSVKAKDRDPNLRSFVQITDVILRSDEDGSIISRNAICFVDTCKYDCTDVNISCKHVKSASECSKTAEELKISTEVLNNLNVTDQMKTLLWEMYEKSQNLIPTVQRINKSTFAIKCNTSVSFPAGRLHVTVIPDDEPEFSFYCACKKLRILLSPNNSVVLENETCEHLLMLLAGFLSTKALQNQYQKFTNAMSAFWTTDTFMSMFNNSLLTTEDFISFSENILNSCMDFETNDNLNSTRILEHDPNLRSKDDTLEEDEIELISIPLKDTDENNKYEDESLELTECQIELMDQFKLTNQIDLCNDDIHLPESGILDESPICEITEAELALEGIPEVESVKKSITINNTNKSQSTNCNSVLTKIVEPNPPGTIQPILEFNNWLEYVIEKLNLCVEFNPAERLVTNNFDMKNDFFTYLSEKFSFGDKRRLPNNTTIIKSGRHKGLPCSTWVFTTTTSVKRIFNNEKISIQFEKEYTEKSPGRFVPYKNEINFEKSNNKKLKKILPTVYKAFIQIGKNENAFIVTWTPNALPQSHFGMLRVQFTLGFKKNNKIIELPLVS